MVHLNCATSEKMIANVSFTYRKIAGYEKQANLAFGPTYIVSGTYKHCFTFSQSSLVHYCEKKSYQALRDCDVSWLRYLVFFCQYVSIRTCM